MDTTVNDLPGIVHNLNIYDEYLYNVRSRYLGGKH